MIPTTAYEELVCDLQRINRLKTAFELLEWDEQVNLPPGSSERRAEEMAALSEIVHRECTHKRVGRWLDELEGGLNGDIDVDVDEVGIEKLTVMREARRNYDRAVKLSAAFVARKSALNSRAFHAWAEARQKGDFELFAPFLQKQLEMAKEEAERVGYKEETAYDYHIDKHDPGLTADFVEKIFSSLKIDLLPLVKRIVDSPVNPDTSIFKGFPREGQEKLLKQISSKLGFDFRRGRIDTSVHPFCCGNGADTRMTTRYDIDNPLNSLFSAIHETGHGLYEQGLPLEHLGTGLSEAAGMAMHESQSRMWENQVGRSRTFWQYWEPVLRETFPAQLADVSSQELFMAINAVSLIPIRVDSDEVTYNLHIILRFELEKKLLAGELAVAELPEAWNNASEEIIGIRPKTVSAGCLQDVHWSGGAFGYFPSYCLGNMIAAQLWYRIKEVHPDIEEDFARGEFGRLLDWLRENVHRLGRQYNTLELTRKITGQELSPKGLIRYLEERYLPLYT